MDLTVTNIVLTLPCIAPSRGPARAIATLAVKSISHMDISGYLWIMINNDTVPYSFNILGFLGISWDILDFFGSPNQRVTQELRF